MPEYILTWKSQSATDGFVLCKTIISAGKLTIAAALRMIPVGEYVLVDCQAAIDQQLTKERAIREKAMEPRMRELREKYIGFPKPKNVAEPVPEPEPGILDEGITILGTHFIRIKHYYCRTGAVEWGQYDRVIEDNYSIRNFLIDDILNDLDNV